MFKLYRINYGNKEEVLPHNGIYIVYELYEYELEYEGKIDKNLIYIEDEILDKKNSFLTYTENGVFSKEKTRIFEDCFGYLTLKINDNQYNFEARIEKLKVRELEQILLYIWNNNPTVFDNFLSKSTLKSKLVKENEQKFDFSSKFVNIFNEFYLFFNKKYYTFKSIPHSALRSIQKIVNYEDANVSDTSIDWLLNNLDELHFDYNYKDAQNAIKIENNYAITEKILTDHKKSCYNVYENQIILGAFDYVILKISKIKKRITVDIPNNQYSDKEFYSIDELRIIPFLKIEKDLKNIEKKIKLLRIKYQTIFEDSKPKNLLPKLTPVFSNKKHYHQAYKQIINIRNIHINLDGVSNLINIKKVSKLYEIYNLYLLVNTLIEYNPINKPTKIKGFPEANQEFEFEFNSFSISLYYDFIVNNKTSKTGLQKISEGHYKPDYIIKKETNGLINYYILDAKYSSESTVKSRHLNECIKKYILDIGITDNVTSKVDELILLYPGEKEQTLYGNTVFKPMISIIPSKVHLDNLKDFIEKIIA
ncbi:hypothetical protein [Tenacibaculum finnmarkense]|uniref:hypothetical protein n=1 Tax=Tenacibaculum finnmarkense TaxID=2781243 RepID=UPI001EFA3023|nr:hypothetical protein [Tenacibaculum finnmarkense]MCG8748693.1 hypothetical protein [Tenacibaculum finnmarkense]